MRPFGTQDAAFILALLNDPDWIRYIGDKNVRTLADAAGYLERGPLAMYREHGLGLMLVQTRDSGEAVGMCGLIRRANLPHVDLGFAFLPAHRGKGYAREAAAAMLDHGHRHHCIARIVAIATPANARSIDVLRAIGMRDAGAVQLAGDDETLALFASEAPLTDKETP